MWALIEPAAELASIADSSQTAPSKPLGRRGLASACGSATHRRAAAMEGFGTSSPRPSSILGLGSASKRTVASPESGPLGSCSSSVMRTTRKRSRTSCVLSAAPPCFSQEPAGGSPKRHGKTGRTRQLRPCGKLDAFLGRPLKIEAVGKAIIRDLFWFQFQDAVRAGLSTDLQGGKDPRRETAIIGHGGVQKPGPVYGLILTSDDGRRNSNARACPGAVSLEKIRAPYSFGQERSGDRVEAPTRRDRPPRCGPLERASRPSRVTDRYA
jgi:hypothetical protein